MSRIAFTGNALGTGTVTMAAPNTNTDQTVTLPDQTGTLYISGGGLGTPSAGTLSNCTGLPLTTGVTGTLPIANGGTGQTAANAAFNALVPSQTGNSGKYLTTDGTNTSWGTLSISSVYPIGSIYINATNSTNPGTLLGFGTWVAFGAGRVPVGFNAADPLFDTAEETGGSKDSVVVSHNHTASVSDPGHAHNVQLGQFNNPGGTTVPQNDDGPVINNYTTGSNTTGISVSIATTGSSGTNANLQPYITVYMWKRTA